MFTAAKWFRNVTFLVLVSTAAFSQTSAVKALDDCYGFRDYLEFYNGGACGIGDCAPAGALVEIQYNACLSGTCISDCSDFCSLVTGYTYYNDICTDDDGFTSGSCFCVA